MQWGSGLSSLGRGGGSLDSSTPPARRVELLRHALNERWKGSPQRKQWEGEFLPRLVREVIGPGSMAAEERLIFQRAPLLRFHVAWPLEPGEVHVPQPPSAGFVNSAFVARPPGTLAMLHKDSDTGHASGEVNFLLPVSLRTHGSNSLWVESAPSSGDYAPLEVRYGQLVQWRGNSLRHYSHRNTELETRVSFDFRVIPGSQGSMVKVVPDWRCPNLSPCACSGRAWRLWAARHFQEEAKPLGAQPLPRVLELAASGAADFTASDHSGSGRSRSPRASSG